MTETAIKLGLVTTLTGPVPGLFRGAALGTQACVAKINSAGGIYGRKLELEVADDQFNQNQFRAQTERLGKKVFAFVGSFSPLDGVMGEPTEKAGIPDVGTAVEATRFNSKVNFSPTPNPPGTIAGGYAYMARKYPDAVKQAGFLGVNEAKAASDAVRGAMKASGWNLVYDDNVSATTTDYTAQVFRMKTAGVRVVGMMGEVAGYAQLLRAAEQQGLELEFFYPVANAYDQRYLKLAGPLTEGTVMAHQYSLFAGEDAGVNSAVVEFGSWFRKIDANASMDLFALYGWTACHLFAQAATEAGPKLTRAGVLAELAKVTKFDGGGLMAASNPAGKQPATCYVLITVSGGAFKRLDTPAPGFRCDGGYFRL